jgi:hypothetical protein
VRLVPVLVLLGVLGFSGLKGQEISSPAASAYLLPQTVFVGDRGRLVVPLNDSFKGLKPGFLPLPRELSRREDLRITSMELEERSGNPRLVIDFVPYAAGLIPFPDLDIPSPEGTLRLNGLGVQVASILDPLDMTLSNPAPVMAAPGTSLFIYGITALVLLFLVLLALGGGFRGAGIGKLLERFRRRRLLGAMKKTLRRRRFELGRERPFSGAEPLSALFRDFRLFLGAFGGEDCRAFTAAEFLDLEYFRRISLGEERISPASLCALFRRSDALRFGGGEISREEAGSVLGALEDFILALEEEEKIRYKPSGAVPESPGEIVPAAAPGGGAFVPGKKR